MTHNPPTAVDGPVRLNLGSGTSPLAGWDNLDRADGREVFPLPHADGSVAMVRASHILEHFSHRDTAAVLADWVRVLEPGGTLQIAVPDFEAISRAYLAGAPIPTEAYVMGGHVDANDHHGAVFDRESLTTLLRDAGLIGITSWTSEANDCAALPVSLNLQGTKRPAAWPKVAAVMSTPRLGFMDNFFASYQALVPLGISLRKHTGAFWGQCLTRAIEQTLAEGEPDYLLTLDYDTVFDRRAMEDLLLTALRHPEADALAPLQASRTRELPLMTMHDADGRPLAEVPADTFAADVTPVATAHFGLTLIKTRALRRLPKPWFLGKPDANGDWGDGRTDDDIHFWRQWAAAGLSLYLANRVPVGHAELMVRWPGRDLKAIYQHPSDFWAHGKPEDAWC